MSLTDIMSREIKTRRLQHTATHCNTLQHTATHCSIAEAIDMAGDHHKECENCNTLQHTATDHTISEENDAGGYHELYEL